MVEPLPATSEALGPSPTPDIKGKGKSISTTSELPIYKYQTLKSDNTIRLLELAPAVDPDNDSDLHARLIEHEVFQQSPTYEPLSYVWGAALLTENLIIDGCSVIKITPSLAEALRHFRHRGGAGDAEPRLVWADAVCINQENKEEKSKQVLKMDIIYRQGAATLAWLGRGFEDNHVAFDGLRTVAGRAWEIGVYSWSLKWGRQMSDAQLKVAVEIVDSLPVASLKSFFGLAWFSRMWIVQEAILSAKVDLFCGDESIPFDELVLACAVFRQCMETVGCGGLSARELEPCWYLAQVRSNFQGFLFPYKGSNRQLPFLRGRREGSTNDLAIHFQAGQKGAQEEDPAGTTVELVDGQKITLMPGMSLPTKFIKTVHFSLEGSSMSGVTGIKMAAPDYLHKRWEQNLTIASPMTLLDYITDAVWSGRKCFDQRDLVYAVIGFKYEHDLRVIPDYTKPIVEIYLDLAVEYLGRQYIRVLYFASQHRLDPFSKQTSYQNDDPWTLPSWAPDWRVHGRSKGWRGVLNDSFRSASAAIPSISISDDNRIVTIRGTLISSIKACMRVILYDPATGKSMGEDKYINIYPEILSMVRTGVLNLAAEDGRYPTGEDVLTALSRVLTADYRTIHMFQGKVTPHSLRDHGEMWVEFERRALAPTGDFHSAFLAYRADPTSGPSPLENPNFTELVNFIRLMLGHLFQHKFGILSNGYMGLFPVDAKEEDMVVVFDGAETPFVLREVGGDSENYILVGDCYVLGLMEGEVLTEEWEGFRMFFSIQ